MIRATAKPLLALLTTILVSGALAGESYKKCPLDTQVCLDLMVSKMKGRGWLGIEYDTETALVQRVVPGSPAERVGFKSGDVMVSVAGAKFASNSDAKCVTCEAV